MPLNEFPPITSWRGLRLATKATCPSTCPSRGLPGPTRTPRAHITCRTSYDSLLRTRDTQSPVPSGGRLVHPTRHDTRSLINSTLSDIWDASSAEDDHTSANVGTPPSDAETQAHATQGDKH